MRTIAHISDLHFGAEEPVIAEGLLRDLGEQQPQLVVISGDLTQRARTAQFQAARNYLDRITVPQIVVPGNHDVPLHNFFDRVLRPLTRYRRWITPEMHPFYQDDEIAVVGVNTARSSTWKEGRISLLQMARLRAQFDSVPAHLFKILVSHHPFIPPADRTQTALVGRARLALGTLEACGCSLILSGHLHRAYGGDTKVTHVKMARSILVAQAGTAISHRRRNESNAYNHIVLDGPKLTIHVRQWDGRKFDVRETRAYRESASGWTTAPAAQ